MSHAIDVCCAMENSYNVLEKFPHHVMRHGDLNKALTLNRIPQALVKRHRRIPRIQNYFTEPVTTTVSLKRFHHPPPNPFTLACGLNRHRPHFRLTRGQSRQDQAADHLRAVNRHEMNIPALLRQLSRIQGHAKRRAQHLLPQQNCQFVVLGLMRSYENFDEMHYDGLTAG